MQTIKLGDVAEFQEGYVNPKQTNNSYFDGPIKWLRAVDLNNSTVFSTTRTLTKKGFESAGKSAYLFPPDSLAISKSGTIGRVGILKDWMCGNRAVINIKPNESITNKKYLFYCLLLGRPQIERLAEGSVQKNLYISELSKFEIPLPILEIQNKIANILGTLDEKIELNKKTNKTHEEIAKALFKSWFIDFDPVKAKAEGRSTGLPNAISNLFPDSFIDSELGEIPRNWGNIPISQFIEINPSRKISKGEVVPYLEMKGVPSYGHTATGVYDREFTSGTKFQQGDTLLARITPCLENGKTAMVDFLKKGQIGWGSTEFIVLCGKEKIHNPFVYYLSRSEMFREHAIRNMIGSSGRQRVPHNSLHEFNIARPPTIILDIFSEIASSFLQKITNGSKEISLLESIRNILLPKLISGEVSIPDAEKMIEEIDS